MSNTLILKARIRKRDKDIRHAVEQLKLEDGEMADMVRDGFRKLLAEIGVLQPKYTPPLRYITATGQNLKGVWSHERKIISRKT